MSKKMKCSICMNLLLSKEEYITHLQNCHRKKYEEYMNSILELNNTDYVLNYEMYFEYGNHNLIHEHGNIYCINNKSIKTWNPSNFKMEASTIWSFPNRGDWATHNSKYRGNWSPYIPRNIILRYSNEGDSVLDQFVGSGTTLVETKLLNRAGIGVDINPDALEISKLNLDFQRAGCMEPVLHHGDARNLSFLADNSVDLICTHPPYANIIKYSDGIVGDLSLYEDIDQFIIELKKVAAESYRVLKSNKYCAILMGDTRRKRHIIPLGFKVMDTFLNAGFVLKEIVIKEQHNCKASGFWYQKSIEYNFLLIAHEYLFIFRKP